MQVRMRSLSTCLGFECRRTVYQDNYMENVSECTCKNMHTLTQAVYKVHRGIKTLINLFLLPGVYSNALEVVMEDIWRWWFRLEETESGPHRLKKPLSLGASRTGRPAWTHRAWKSLSRHMAKSWDRNKITKVDNKSELNLVMRKESMCSSGVLKREAMCAFTKDLAKFNSKECLDYVFHVLCWWQCWEHANKPH